MGVEIRPADQPGDLGWMVWQHGEVYAEQFGWDTSFEAMVAGVVGDYARRRQTSGPGAGSRRSTGGGSAASCAVPLPEDTDTRPAPHPPPVTPDGRGLGAGTALVDECVAFARPRATGR